MQKNENAREWATYTLKLFLKDSFPRSPQETNDSEDAKGGPTNPRANKVALMTLDDERRSANGGGGCDDPSDEDEEQYEDAVEQIWQIPM